MAALLVSIILFFSFRFITAASSAERSTLFLPKPLDFQDRRTLRVSLSCLCNAERALGYAPLRALPGSPLPHRWYARAARASRKESAPRPN
jgi:hypothetical protein